MADLERVLQQFHDSEINAGVQTFFDAGMRIGASVMDQLSLPLRSCALTNADYADSSQIDLIRILWQCPIFMFLHKGKLERTCADQRLDYSSASHR